MPRLNETDRLKLVYVILTFVRQFGVHRNTVDALWRGYQQFGTTRDLPWSGCPCVMSNRQDMYMYMGVVQTATLTA